MKYKGKICKGSWEFNNNCRVCEKCVDTKPKNIVGGYSVTVNIEDVPDEGKVNVYISYPKSQPRMTLKKSCHALVAGINVMIKGCNHNDVGIKDHELLEEVIDHLKSEFIDAKSFEDAVVNEEVIKITKEESDKQ